MIKKFENYKELSKLKPTKTYYVITDMQDGIIEATLLFDNKKSAHNYIINMVHQIDQNWIEENDDSYNCENIFDPYELLDYYNSKHGIQSGIQLFLSETTLQEPQILSNDLKLKMSANKYNI